MLGKRFFLSHLDKKNLRDNIMKVTLSREFTKLYSPQKLTAKKRSIPNKKKL